MSIPIQRWFSTANKARVDVLGMWDYAAGFNVSSDDSKPRYCFSVGDSQCLAYCWGCGKVKNPLFYLLIAMINSFDANPKIIINKNKIFTDPAKGEVWGKMDKVIRIPKKECVLIKRIAVCNLGLVLLFLLLFSPVHSLDNSGSIILGTESNMCFKVLDTDYCTVNGEPIYSYNGIPFSIKLNSEGSPLYNELLLVGPDSLGFPQTATLPINGYITTKIHFLQRAGYALSAPNGYNGGKITVFYQDGTSDTIDLIIGVNTAEWSYDRPENQQDLAHSKITPAYSWLQDIHSASSYYGNSFYSSIDTETKPVERIELYQNRNGGGGVALVIDAITLESDGIHPPELNSNPRVTNVVLRSSANTNYPNEDLMVQFDSLNDAGLQNTNIVNWNKDGSSITYLNMPFEGGSNHAIAQDYSGYGHHGTVYGATWIQTGGLQGSGAYVFDGTNDYIDPGRAIFPSVQRDFTMELWVYPLSTRTATSESNAADNYQGIRGQRYAIWPAHGNEEYGNGHAGAGISVGTNGVSVFEHAGYYIPSLLVYDTPITGWTHVVVVYENNQPRLYVNGELVRTGLRSTKIVHPSQYIGEAGFGYGYYHGYVDNVRVYNRSLSAEQIRNLYGERTDRVVAQETAIGDVWQACVTPNDGYAEGDTVCSNPLIVGGTTITTVEQSSTSQNPVVAFLARTASINNAVGEGDLNGFIDISSFEMVWINSGSFTGKGFTKGTVLATLESIPYQGQWQGMFFVKESERKIYLKGTISGDISGVVEGYLTESTPESGNYDQYTATWRINRIGTNHVSATFTVRGSVSNQGESTYPSTQLYVLQTFIQGETSGYYTGPLDIVLTHVRVADETNPYNGEGFSIISFTSDSGTGEGWTYDKEIRQDIIEMNGLFTKPLLGKVAATLDETRTPRTLTVILERMDIGLPPAPDLNVKVWGPNRISPGQKFSYMIEISNQGTVTDKNISINKELSPNVKLIDATSGFYYNSESHSIFWNYEELKPFSKISLFVNVETKWGLPANTIIEDPVTIKDWQQLINTFYGGINFRNQQEWNSRYQSAMNFDSTLRRSYLGTDQISGSVHTWLASKGIATIENYLTTDEGDGNYPIAFSHSGGTQTLYQKIMSEKVHVDYAVFVAPALLTQDMMNNLIQSGKVKKVIIVQSEKDVLYNLKTRLESNSDKLINTPSVTFVETPDDLALVKDIRIYIKPVLDQANIDPSVVPYLEESYIGGASRTQKTLFQNQDFDQDGKDDIITITENFPNLNSAIDVHSALLQLTETMFSSGAPPFDGDINGLKPTSLPVMQIGKFNSIVAVARDPNIKYGPEGRVLPGQKLEYRVEFENEGEGIAFGVYFTDTLDPDLDDSTLVIGPVKSTVDGSIIAPTGIYNPATRTITWLVGEVGSRKGGYTDISVNVRSEAPDGTEVINYGTVYFPSVPEITRTNGIVSIVNLNQAPVLDPIEPKSIDEGQQLQFQVSATDTDGDTLTYTTGTLPTGAAFDAVTKTFTWTPEYNQAGIYTVTFTASDGKLMDVEDVIITVNEVENVPPITVLDADANPGNNGWYLSDVTITLFATDNEGGSGIATTEYSFDGAVWTTYQSPITISQEGITMLYYRSIDNAGNTEDRKQEDIHIDKTLPDISVSVPVEGKHYTLNQGVVVDYTVNDLVSGVASIEASTPKGQPLPTLTAGSNVFTIKAIDFAGNTATKTVKYIVDVPVKVKIVPRVMNLGSKGVFLAFVTLPDEYKGATIDMKTVTCSGAPALRMMRLKIFPRIVGFVFKTGDLERVNPGEKVSLTLQGQLKNKDTTYTFTGSDTVRVITKTSWQPDDIKEVSKVSDDELFRKYSS